jgi:hypothetical protein
MKKTPVPYFELIPLLIMLAGFILRWLSIDPQAIVLHAGFVILALAGIYSSIRTNSNARIYNLITYSLIIVLVIIHFIMGVQVFPFIVIGLLVQYLINQRKAKVTS